MKLLCTAMVLFLASIASAQTTIWGVTLGKPTNLPICEHSVLLEQHPCQTEGLPFEGYTANSLGVNGGDHRYAPDATEIDGNLESMSMEMSFICDEFFAGLKEKFGQPSGSAKHTYHTGLGIPVTVTTFVWNRKHGDQISFSIPYPKVDQCQFVASTLKWRSLKPNKVKF